ncbi:hypothetical protein Btru_036776 [Bulinus truncatus]|nr:hypothetical protein Btru_036776 [Bulinus truncatus]
MDLKTNKDYVDNIFPYTQPDRGNVIYTGPEGVGNYRPHLADDIHVIGIGENSPLFSSDTSYLFRPPPGASSQRPRCALPGEIGWGIPWLVDWSPPKTGQQIVVSLRKIVSLILYSDY